MCGDLGNTFCVPWSTKTLEQSRLEAVGLALAPGANRTLIARRFKVSRKTLYNWMAIHLSGVELSNRSCRPLSSPRRSSSEMELAVAAVRQEHPWGGRKIARVLERDFGMKVSPSTVTEILRRQGLLCGSRAGEPRSWQRFERQAPNELWQMDYKGHFGMLSSARCHPFACVDDHSRFNLSLAACANEQTPTVQACLTAAFRTYGMPLAILCDNGGCWGTTFGPELTPLAIWLSRLDIELIHGRPYHPQTQGKLERFNETLKLEALSGRSFRDLPDCQRAFDRFRHEYNHIRPHEALGLSTPMSVYAPSPRSFPEGALPDLQYPEGYAVRKVQSGGIVHFQGREHRVGKGLQGCTVGIRPLDADGRYEVRYGRTRLAMLELRHG